MSETLNQTDETILSEDEITQQGGSSSWRPAKGKFVQGKEIIKQAEVDGQLIDVETGKYPQEKKVITGLLRRIGIFEADGKYGKQHKLECDIETKAGMLHLGTTLLDSNDQFKVGIAALNLAWCLLQFEKDGPIYLETAWGDPVKLPNGKEGGRPTYINAYRVEGTNATPIYRPKRDPNAPKLEMNEQWPALETQLRAHTAYKDREITQDPANPTHLSELVKWCKEKGWSSPDENPSGWLDLANAGFKTGLKSRLNDYTDDQWGEIRQAVAGMTDMPTVLEPKVEQKGFAL